MLFLLSVLPAFVFASRSNFDAVFDKTLATMKAAVKGNVRCSLKGVFETVESERFFFSRQEANFSEEELSKRWATGEPSEHFIYFAKRICYDFRENSEYKNEMVRNYLQNLIHVNLALDALKNYQDCTVFNDAKLNLTNPALGIVLKFKPSAFSENIRVVAGAELLPAHKEEFIYLSLQDIKLKIAEKDSSIKFPRNFFPVLKELLDWKIKNLNFDTIDCGYTDSYKLMGKSFPSVLAAEVEFNEVCFKDFEWELKAIIKGFMLGFAEQLKNDGIEAEYSEDSIMSKNWELVRLFAPKSCKSAYVKVGDLRSGHEECDSLCVEIREKMASKKFNPNFETEVTEEVKNNSTLIGQFENAMANAGRTYFPVNPNVSRVCGRIRNPKPAKKMNIMKECEKEFKKRFKGSLSVEGEKNLEFVGLECVVYNSDELSYLPMIN